MKSKHFLFTLLLAFVMLAGTVTADLASDVQYAYGRGNLIQASHNAILTNANSTATYFIKFPARPLTVSMSVSSTFGVKSFLIAGGTKTTNGIGGYKLIMFNPNGIKTNWIGVRAFPTYGYVPEGGRTNLTPFFKAGVNVAMPSAERFYIKNTVTNDWVIQLKGNGVQGTNMYGVTFSFMSP